MTIRSVNPATGMVVETYPEQTAAEVDAALAAATDARRGWSGVAVSGRVALLSRVAESLRAQRDELAGLITQEMGKLFAEACAEIEKCAWVCDYYAEQAAQMLADEVIESDAGHSCVTHEPLGVVLAVMPWNFPFWQVFRCVVPALAAGNVVLLKHASNVTGCAFAIDRLFRQAGFPKGVLQVLRLGSAHVARVIAHPSVAAVALTGSEAAGRAVAAAAGAHLKKCVLELGGSDPFIVLEDADLELTVQQAVASRFANAGQSCIAAKRFLVHVSVHDDFIARLRQAVEGLAPGDPMRESTSLAPMARHDLRDQLHSQVQQTRQQGARVVTGCIPGVSAGAFYEASILTNVEPGTPAFEEELFGPVAAITAIHNDQEAILLANQSRYGLGSSVWTNDLERGERLSRQMQAGSAFVNGMVKSDPRLPFGGIKASGYGRELSHHGLKEFLNLKTLWIR